MTKTALKGNAEKLAELYFLDRPAEQVIEELVANVVNDCSHKLKVKATLLQCYHHAIHNRYYQAKQLLMRSNLINTISKQQISNQICFNRAVVQIGLSAFRLGMFEECNQTLQDIAQNPKLKETLAQGSSSRLQQEKTLEEEIEEKKRFVPPHLQINLEQVDCVYMTTSMMLEVVNISENKFSVQRKVISRNFRKLIEQYDIKGIQFVP